MAQEMEKEGRYSANNVMTYRVSEKAMPWVRQALDTALKDVQGSTNFTMCDFGAADGGMTSFVAANFVKLIRTNPHGSQRQISIFIEDQPANDFSVFFNKFQHDITENKDDEHGVFVGAIGRSFYKQCLPDNSVDLAITNTAAHWLNMDDEAEVIEQTKNSWVMCMQKAECERAGQQLPEQLAKALQVCKAKAAKDWELFLLHRAKELKPGGVLVTINLTGSEAGKNTPLDVGFRAFAHGVLNCIVNILKELAADGVVTKEEVASLHAAGYCRTADEFCKPFDDPESPVRKAGLTLTRFEPMCVSCPIEEAILKGEMTKAEGAEKIANSTRTVAYQFVAAALSSTRSEEEKRKILEIFFERSREKWMQADATPAFPYPMSLMVMQKKA